MKVRTIKQNELSPEVRDAARRAMAGCPHGNTARRKCVHCDVEDSERALAAADRLAEAVNALLWNKQGIGSCDNGAFSYYAAKGELILRVSDEVSAYLAERGR